MKRFLKAPAFSCVVVALFAALLLKGGGAEAAPMQSYGSNNIDAGAQPFKALNAVVEVSANDVWAVGGSGQTLIEHWNGEHWRIVASPNPPGSTGSLGAVAEVSAHDIWAVGTFKNSTGGLPLIEHWDGEQWSIVASPNPTGSSITVLNGVAEVSAHNVWAVGRTNQSLTEHWNGKQWSIVASPNPTGSSFTFLNGVEEVSARNIWAVGVFFTRSAGGMPLIEHWNGVQWSIVPGAD